MEEDRRTFMFPKALQQLQACSVAADSETAFSEDMSVLSSPLVDNACVVQVCLEKCVWRSLEELWSYRVIEAIALYW